MRRKNFTQTLNSQLPHSLKRGEVTKEVGYVEIRTLEDNVKEQNSKIRREGISKEIEKPIANPCKVQKYHLLTRGLQATHKLQD